jgi:hypothetical protein
MARTIGTVKWFNDAKGFGFITPEIPAADAGKQTWSRRNGSHHRHGEMV